MHPKVSEKLLKIVEEIAECGNASLTRLTVLKKWFAREEQLSAFVIWMAADYCQHYGSRYGNGLNVPSATKIEEIVRLMFQCRGTEGRECMNAFKGEP